MNESHSYMNCTKLTRKDEGLVTLLNKLVKLIKYLVGFNQLSLCGCAIGGGGLKIGWFAAVGRLLAKLNLLLALSAYKIG